MRQIKMFSLFFKLMKHFEVIRWKLWSCTRHHVLTSILRYFIRLLTYFIAISMIIEVPATIVPFWRNVKFDKRSDDKLAVVAASYQTQRSPSYCCSFSLFDLKYIFFVELWFHLFMSTLMFRWYFNTSFVYIYINLPMILQLFFH